MTRLMLAMAAACVLAACFAVPASAQPYQEQTIQIIIPLGPGGATEHWPIWIYQETMGFFRFGYGAALALTLAIALLIFTGLYAAFARLQDS